MAMVVSVQADLKNFTTEMDRGMKKIDQFGVNSSRATDSVQKMTDSLNKLTGNAIPGLSSLVPQAAAVKTGIEGMLGAFRLFKETDFFKNKKLDLIDLHEQISKVETVQKSLNVTTASYGLIGSASVAANATSSVASIFKERKKDVVNLYDEISKAESVQKTFNATTAAFKPSVNTGNAISVIAKGHGREIARRTTELTRLDHQIIKVEKSQRLLNNASMIYDVRITTNAVPQHAQNLSSVEKKIVATEKAQKMLNTTTLAYGGLAVAGIGAVIAVGYSLYKVFEDINTQAEVFEKKIQNIERRMTDLANKSNSLVKEQFTTEENEAEKLAEYDQAINDLQNAMRREQELIQKIVKLQARVDSGPQDRGDAYGTRDIGRWRSDKKELEQARIEFSKLATGISEMANMEDLIEARSRFQEKIDQRIKDEEEKRIAAEEAAAQKKQELLDRAAADEEKRLADIEKERQRIHDQEMNSYRQLVESLDPAVKTMRELQEAEAMLIKMREKGLITPEYAQQLWDEALKKASESDKKTEKKSTEKKRESNAAVMSGSTEDYTFRFANKGQDKQISLLQSSLDTEKKMESSLATIADNSKNSNIDISRRGR